MDLVEGIEELVVEHESRVQVDPHGDLHAAFEQVQGEDVACPVVSEVEEEMLVSASGEAEAAGLVESEVEDKTLVSALEESGVAGLVVSKVEY